MLTNHDLDSGSPLAILLIGQPPCGACLRVGYMTALDQRVQLRYHIPAPALTPAEASGTSAATLSTPAGPTPCSPTTPSRHHAHARALPRAVNRLAVTALLAACATGKTIVDESAARTAISEEAAAATD